MQYKAYSLRNRKNGSRKDGGLYMSLRCSKPITSLSSNPPSPRIPVVPRVLESPRAPSIHTGGDSIMPWWKAMENQLGIQGRASTMHGHMARRRQAICCDEEALYTARLRSPSSPNEPSPTFPKPDTPAHQHTSNHRAAHAWGLHGLRDVLRCVLSLFKDCSKISKVTAHDLCLNKYLIGLYTAKNSASIIAEVKKKSVFIESNAAEILLLIDMPSESTFWNYSNEFLLVLGVKWK